MQYYYSSKTWHCLRCKKLSAFFTSIAQQDLHGMTWNLENSLTLDTFQSGVILQDIAFNPSAPGTCALNVTDFWCIK